jgi:hypothetical protein
MLNPKRLPLFAWAGLLLCALSLTRAAAATPLEDIFRSPGRVAEPWVYWIWINGNVTKDGIRADLEDMRRTGIGGAMLFDGSLYLPKGPVRYGTDGWHEHMQFMLKTAAELDIKIVLMNCAGWATSGGPWNDVGRSMKMIVWSEQSVPDGAAGREWRGKLPPPPSRLGYYRDVAVLAVPDSDEAAPALTDETTHETLPALADRDGATSVEFAQGAKIRIAYARPETMRRLEIDLVQGEHKESIEGLGTDDDLTPGGLIEASDDGRVFRIIKKFAPGRQEFGSRVEINFDATTAKYFRVSLQPRPGGVAATVLGAGAGARKPWRISELRLANVRRLDNLPGKTGLKTLPPLRSAEWDAGTPGEFKSDQVIDLTGRLAADGSLEWNAPAGRWTILRFGHTTSARKNHPSPPEGEGLEVDKFDGDAVARHFEGALGRVIREAGPDSARALAGVLSDSWEAGPQTWTGKLQDTFAQKRGYTMRRFLPALTGRIIDSPRQTEVFLADYRRTLGELYADNYYATLQRMCARHGMRYFAEAYGGVIDEARALEHVDVPMVEFWTFGLYKGFDYATSVAHLTGARVIGAEAFTGRPPRARWSEHPFALKALGDAAYAEGINSLVLHSYVHQPRTELAPGFTHGRYGTHFGRLNSWWPLAPAWIDYLQRCQLVLQHGHFAADILCLRDERLKMEQRELLPAVLAGHKSDLISVSQLAWLDVNRDGALCAKSGAAYRALLLPETWIASTETLKQLARLKAAGAALSGPPPFAPATLEDTSGEGARAWRVALDAVFGDGQCARPLPETLAALGVTPDFRVKANENTEPGAGADLRFLHRTAADGDYYFITNQSGRAVSAEIDLRVGDRRPELWDPVSGKIADAPVYRVENNRTILPLMLGESDSVFVVFRKPRPAAWPVAIFREGAPAIAQPDYSQPGRALLAQAGKHRVMFSDGRARTVVAPGGANIIAGGPWTVLFKSATRHSPRSITMDKLVPLEKHGDAEIRHFSGLAVYTTALEIPESALAASRRVFLNLGGVHDLAEITINGRSAGVCWKPPFTLDVTELARAGSNELKITVANRWVNRLIGDEQLPSDLDYGTTGSTLSTLNALQKFPSWWNDRDGIHRRARQTFSTWKHYTADSPLVPSGLAGPVTLEIRPALVLSPNNPP